MLSCILYTGYYHSHKNYFIFRDIQCLGETFLYLMGQSRVELSKAKVNVVLAVKGGLSM